MTMHSARLETKKFSEQDIISVKVCGIHTLGNH